MPLDLTATATPLEGLWTLACVVTATVNAWALWDAWADLAAVDHLRTLVTDEARRDPNRTDPRLPVAARGAVRREAGRLLVMLAFLALGLYALTTPATYRTDGSANPNAMLLPWLAVAVAAIFALEAILDRRDRLKILAMTRARRATLREPEGAA